MWYLVSLITSPKLKNAAKIKCKSTTSNVFFQELVMNLVASTGVFRKKSKIIFDFCL